jgi:hypothetical protein
MPPKKHARPLEERNVKRKCNDITQGFWSLNDIAASSLPIVVISDNPTVPACYVTAEHLRTHVCNWLTHGDENFDLCAFMLKCRHDTTLVALAKPFVFLHNVNWTRLVDYLCVLHVLGANLSEFGEALQNCFNDDVETTKSNKSLLCAKLKELTVLDVTRLARLTDNLNMELCTSYVRLGKCMVISQLSDVIRKLGSGRDSCRFLEYVHRQNGPECDRRLLVE